MAHPDHERNHAAEPPHRHAEARNTGFGGVGRPNRVSGLYDVLRACYAVSGSAGTWSLGGVADIRRSTMPWCCVRASAV